MKWSLVAAILFVQSFYGLNIAFADSGSVSTQLALIVPPYNLSQLQGDLMANAEGASGKASQRFADITSEYQVVSPMPGEPASSHYAMWIHL